MWMCFVTVSVRHIYMTTTCCRCLLTMNMLSWSTTRLIESWTTSLPWKPQPSDSHEITADSRPKQRFRPEETAKSWSTIIYIHDLNRIGNDKPTQWHPTHEQHSSRNESREHQVLNSIDRSCRSYYTSFTCKMYTPMMKIIDCHRAWMISFKIKL